MKTLDEVIFEAPYSPTSWEADALHYLKVYKNTDENYRKAITHVNKIIDHYEKMVADYLSTNNPALSWDELKTMEGKPVWVDPLSTKALHTPGWGLVGKTSFTTWEGVECCSIVKVGVTYALPVGEYGKTWQAYRKERHDDVG